MATYLGKHGNLHLFTSAGNAAVLDETLNLVVETGSESSLSTRYDWDFSSNAPENSALVELASGALSSLDISVVASAGRLYTVPKAVQAEARRALEWFDKFGNYGGTPVGLSTARTLAAGGQITLDKVRHISGYFSRHENDRTTFSRISQDQMPSMSQVGWSMWGGDAARKWTKSLSEAENLKALTADGFPLSTYEEDVDAYAPVPEYDTEIDPFREALELDETVGPEFLARVRNDGSGIDRLYRIDPDGEVFVWDDGTWDDLGHVDENIWAYDAELDMPDGDIVDFVGKTHVVIDPESAIIISAHLQQYPHEYVSIEAIDEAEATLAAESTDLDWEVLDSVLVAAGGTPGDGIYTPEERSENAGTQVRDKNGKFAKTGSRVMVNGDPKATGKISRVNPADGTVEVTMESGGAVVVPGKSVEGVSEYTATIPGKPVEVQRVDMSGILGEPRTPINRVGAQIPGTLPAMTRDDLHRVINDFPAWVKSQRDQFIEIRSGKVVAEQPKNSLDQGDADPKMTVDAYKHPLLQRWLKRKENKRWYNPIIAAAGAPAVAEEDTKEKAVNPDTSDVQPIYLAIVSPEDPRAVFELVGLVPASTTSNAPMTYTRKGGKWERNPQILSDLNSATPPPVVPLDSETLNDVLTQVDGNTGITASISLDHAIMVLWGSRSSIVAAGGADRNRGGAEKLRRYWMYGAGAAKIRWGTGGDWTRCVRHLGKYLGPRAKGYCSLRHKEITGMWTGDKRHRQMYGRKASGLRTFSSDVVRSSESILESSYARANADAARERVFGIQASATVTGGRFRIPLVVPEGIESGDGRIVLDDALDMRLFPLPLLWQIKTAEGHDGAVVVGRIDYMERIEGGIGDAYGYFDTGAYGREAERMVRNRFLRGISVDLDKFEAKADTSPEASEDEGTIKNRRNFIQKARVMAATIVAKPSFQECFIEMDEDPIIQEEIVIPDGVYADEPDPVEAASLVACGYVASAIPLSPPQSWFENPKLNSATPLTVTDEGRVYGHIAAWHVDHIGMSFGTRPPRSRSSYAYFHTGVVRTDEGSDIPVGQLTLAGGHASIEASAAQAVKHYDDTASAIADVHAGEDEFGIWVSGALRPGATPEQIRSLRASAPSGDWRPVRGHLELVAVCQVNVPGFPVARARVASGQVTALVAAGASVLAKMKSDPITELSSRLEALEAPQKAELSARAAEIKARFQEASGLKERMAELSARVHNVQSPGGVIPSQPVATTLQPGEQVAPSTDLRARVASAAARLGEFETTDERKIRELLEEKGQVVPEDPKADSRPDTVTEEKGIYTPKTQPRDARGRFRDVLARLRDNLGVNGNQEIIEKLETTENLTNTGDYVQASKSADDLISHIDRLDDGALNAESITNVREAATDLSTTIANLPLPFNNQAQKVRFSDIPPALKELIKDFVTRVETKIGKEESADAVNPLKSFMSGGDMFSQAEVSEHMNRLLRLLT